MCPDGLLGATRVRATGGSQGAPDPRGPDLRGNLINEHADPDVARDLLAAYEAMIPKIRFAHAEGNSDAHLMSTVLGSSVTIPVSDGRLRLGTWQGIFFVELDGPRTRKVWVSVH